MISMIKDIVMTPYFEMIPYYDYLDTYNCSKNGLEEKYNFY